VVNKCYSDRFFFSGEYFLFSLVSIIPHTLHTNLNPHATLARKNEQRAKTFQKKRSFAMGGKLDRKVIPLFLLCFLLRLHLFLLTLCRYRGHCCTWSQTHARTHAHGRTPLHDWSASRRDLYLTTHNSHKRQTSMFIRRNPNPQSQNASSSRSMP